MMKTVSVAFVPRTPIFVEGAGARDIALFLSLTRNYKIMEVRQDTDVWREIDRTNVVRCLKSRRDIVVVEFFHGKSILSTPESDKLRKVGAKIVSIRRGVRYSLPVLFWDFEQPVSKLLKWVDSEPNEIAAKGARIGLRSSPPA